MIATFGWNHRTDEPWRSEDWSKGRPVPTDSSRPVRERNWNHIDSESDESGRKLHLLDGADCNSSISKT